VNEESSTGRIITFYSFKGGTGRSMALANIAWILASNGMRVLVVDWDLEGPGLHRYFHPFLLDEHLDNSEGIIDFVQNFESAARLSERDIEAREDWFMPHTNLLRYAVSLEIDAFPKPGTIDFVPAGRQDAGYSIRVNGFNWREFYQKLGGGIFLEAVKKRLRQEYDYILIDSRTGVSDTSGICTVQMPDDLVVCFTLNSQSIDGAAAVAHSAVAQRKKGSEATLTVWPVPMRVEMVESDKLEAARDYVHSKFDSFIDHFDPSEQEKYWGSVEVLYEPFYAYEEVLCTLKDRSSNSKSMLASMEAITEYLSKKEIRQLQRISEAKRTGFLDLYLRRGRRTVGDRAAILLDLAQTLIAEAEVSRDTDISDQVVWDEVAKILANKSSRNITQKIDFDASNKISSEPSRNQEKADVTSRIFARKAPEFPQSLLLKELSSLGVESSYTVDIITALFGGGVEPSENDPIALVRVPAIRGHLRFWWRATRGAEFESSDELWRREEKIWGSTTEPSRIEITVSLGRLGRQESCEGLITRGRLGYALFPFQGNARENKRYAVYTRDAQFTLSLRYPEELASDVKAALWAWVNFGGLGARTRRGCGALFCKELAPGSADNVTDWLRANRAEFGLNAKQLRPWPTFGTVLVNPLHEVPERAWSNAIGLLHRFRQGDIGRNAGQNGRPGRSRWPEADSIRALTGQTDPRHAQSTTLDDPAESPAFPRASLGLPIVFHFKDRQDPAQLELYPAWTDSSREDLTRMASPIILRPLAVGNGTKALAMILRLKTPPPAAVRFSDSPRFKDGSGGRFTGKRVISRPDLTRYAISPMKRRSAMGSALQSFLSLAKEEGFQEVG
jgi:CRISPR type III-B/RAMP module RAMP protein Cmr1